MSKSPLRLVILSTFYVSDVRNSLSPVSAQQQISTSRNGTCAVVSLTSIPTPRLNRLKTRGSAAHFWSRPGHPAKAGGMDDLLRFRITKQAVQMHSTATDVGKLVVDGKNSLANTLIRFSFQNTHYEGDGQR